MAEVFLRLFQHAADAFLFRDVVVQFLNVFFRLFRALVFELGASTFSFLGLTCRSFHFAHVAVVAEVDDDDDGNADGNAQNRVVPMLLTIKPAPAAPAK